MGEPIPYFSDLTATKGKEPSEKHSGARKNKVFSPHLGLPCRRIFSSVVFRPLPKQHFLDPAAAAASQKSQKVESILSQVETPTIVAKEIDEINRPNFLSLAAQNTVEGFVKVAQKKARQLNPLEKAQKRRKLDIFDL